MTSFLVLFLPVSFGNFVEEVKSQLSALVAYASRDMVVMPLLENRLPTSIRIDWEREVHSMVDEGKTPTTKLLCVKTFVKGDNKAEKRKSQDTKTQPSKTTSAQFGISSE